MNDKNKGFEAEPVSDAELKKILSSIGIYIKQSREEAPTTLDTLSYEVGVSRSLLSRLEAGDDVKLSNFIKVIIGLKIKPSDMFKGIIE